MVILIISYVLHCVLGGYALYLGVQTSAKELTQATIVFKIIYWYGLVFGGIYAITGFIILFKTVIHYVIT